jgi:hypothetical protein
MENRKNPRMKRDNLLIDVYDGIGFFQGLVFDFSRFGMCLTDLPNRLNGTAKKMTAIATWKGKYYRMNVRPRWFTGGNARKSVGVEIINPPWNWTEFVMEFEPEIAKEVWGTIHH